ncbi:hypothetical protein SAMN03159284_00767 [Mucilaginibacter sp. NFR10]|nr:hypothetical protein SAMN03159284_00767 [Mucilaginibacter sp. NFR10]
MGIFYFPFKSVEEIKSLPQQTLFNFLTNFANYINYINIISRPIRVIRSN